MRREHLKTLVRLSQFEGEADADGFFTLADGDMPLRVQITIDGEVVQGIGQIRWNEGGDQ